LLAAENKKTDEINILAIKSNKLIIIKPYIEIYFIVKIDCLFWVFFQ
jgi:hypothetical protein